MFVGPTECLHLCKPVYPKSTRHHPIFLEQYYELLLCVKGPENYS